MQVTFLGHSGFYVELPEANLLFDYYIGELPKPDPEKPLYVFVSHAHADHFSRDIFRLPEGRAQADTVFVLSDDIPKRARPSFSRPGAEGHNAGKTEVLYLKPLEDRTVSGLRVRTLPSTDEGVAFLVDAPTARIYHAGDLNRWHWEEENEEDRLFNLDQQKRYAEAMERLAGMVREDGRQIDLAFVPLDNRLKEPGCWYGIEEFQEAAGARYLFPMHLFGDPGIIERLKERSAADAWKDRVLGSGKPGEQFEL